MAGRRRGARGGGRTGRVPAYRLTGVDLRHCPPGARETRIPGTCAVRSFQAERATRVATGAVAHLADGSEWRARLVAAADGKDSPLRRAADIYTVEWRYRQTGIVTTVRHQHPHAGIAVEQLPPVMAHDRQRIMRRELQAVGLQRFAQQLGELQA